MCAAVSLAALGETLEIAPTADVKTCRAREINRLVAKAKPGDTILFRKGEYFVNESIAILDRTNVMFRAERGTVFRMRYKGDGRASSGMMMFAVRGCSDVVLDGFACTTENPPSGTGRVSAVNPDTREYDVRFEGDTNFAGTESLVIADTCDDYGTPDGVFTEYALNDSEEPDGNGGTTLRKKGIPYKLLSKGTIRLKLPAGCDLTKLRIGHRIVFRYGGPGGIFSFQSSHRVTVRDVDVWRCPSMVAVISGRSSDLTFERLAVRPAAGSGAIFSSNADGIHVASMFGTLTLKDCVFDGMGDDPLNVHGKSSELSAYDPASGKATCTWQLFHRGPQRMAKLWAVAGDVLDVYDRRTFLPKGRVRVKATEGYGEMTLADATAPLAIGDIVINGHDCPKVRVSGCRVRNIRSRGFLLQSRDIVVSDCSFEGIGGAGIMAAPDINNWFESGPISDLRVERCSFVRCAIRPSVQAAFLVKVNHEGPVDAYPSGVHRNISLKDCTFRDCPSTNVVCIASTDGVEVKGNRFENCGGKPVAVINCTRVDADGANGADVVRNSGGSKPITMMSFNVRVGCGLDGAWHIPEGELGHLPQCADVIKSVDPDWVAIQEIDRGTKRTGRVDQTAALARLCGMNGTYLKKIDYDGGDYGVAVLSKEKPLSVSKILVPGSAHTRCIAILEFRDYIVACTHFPLEESARVKAAEIACLNLSGREKPVFFAGDFNAIPSSPTIATLKKSFTVLSDSSRPTFRSDKPDRCLDYIMVDSAHADCVKVATRDVIAAPNATDHCAIVVKAELADGCQSTAGK